MHFDHVMHDGKSQSKSTISARGGTVGLAESFEDVRQKVRVDASAVIGDGNLCLTRREIQLRLNVSALTGELHGVREQIPDRLLQAARIAPDLAGPSERPDFELDSFCFGARPDNVDGGAKNTFDFDGSHLEFKSACDDPRHIENVVDQLAL